MATQQPPKKPRGILKKPRSDAAPTPDGPATRSQDARQIAVRHATLIQQRKELEATVLHSLITLSEYPLVRTPNLSASNPAASDIADFKSHIRLFQPTDFDDLVVERNANGLCGYALCPKPNKQLASGAKWKLVNMGKQDFDIISREELEKWCSQDCRRRALWVRIQLGETAAWERVGIPEIQIGLYGEDEKPSSDADAVAQDFSLLKLDEQRKAIAATEALALERGENPESTTKRNLVDVVIREKEPSEMKQEDIDAPVDEDDGHLLMEGYKVKFATGK